MEMTNNRCAFNHYEGNNSEIVAYEEITAHLILYLHLFGFNSLEMIFTKLACFTSWNGAIINGFGDTSNLGMAIPN